MIILSIETSCDETAVSIVEALGDFPTATYEIRGNALFSQIETHREFGGVFPSLAKREHALTLVPMLEEALRQANLDNRDHHDPFPEDISHIHELLFREPGLADNLLSFSDTHNTPAIDLIAVTAGPGLEPALWVGVNFAKALSHLWNTAVVSVNHMEGHVFASVFNGHSLAHVEFPALSLLISGAHTELILMKQWKQYEKIGQTRDDAVGEAFDKVARMLGLPYPGGPEIEKLAAQAREKKLHSKDLLGLELPRPMLTSPDYDFSFSGIKTAVRYAVEGKQLTEDERCAIAREFQDAVTQVLIGKTQRAVDAYGIQSLIIGGGVSASAHLGEMFTDFFNYHYPDLRLYIPEKGLTTDNSIMIALAGHAHADSALDAQQANTLIRADGNRSIADE